MNTLQDLLREVSRIVYQDKQKRAAPPAALNYLNSFTPT